jgi:hypothetical protein
MVPTFSADPGPAGNASFGDLPLMGEGGGEPNSEPSSSWAGGESSPSTCIKTRDEQNERDQGEY